MLRPPIATNRFTQRDSAMVLDVSANKPSFGPVSLFRPHVVQPGASAAGWRSEVAPLV